MSSVARVAILAIVGQGIAYSLSVFLARTLGVAGFEAYVVASAAFILMVAIAPLGVEKLALRSLPALLFGKDWEGARGFLRFGVRRTLLSACIIAVVVGLGVWWTGALPIATSTAILVTCVSLPGGALAHFGLEALTAAGQEVRATAIFRVVIPAVAFALVGLCVLLFPSVSGAVAVGSWGVAWIVGVALLTDQVRRAIPSTVWRAAPREKAATWRAEGWPFWIYRVAVALMAQSSILMLEFLQPSATAVGAYAAALATAAPALVLVTATNRGYAREMAVLLERGDRSGLRALDRTRLRWLAPTIAVFLVIALVLPRQALALFGPAFVDEGVGPLRIIAVTTSFTMLLALSPTYLKYTRQHRAIVMTVGAAAVAQILLLVLLVPKGGATAAAIATAVSNVGMYGAFAIAARHSIAQLGAGKATQALSAPKDTPTSEGR